MALRSVTRVLLAGGVAVAAAVPVPTAGQIGLPVPRPVVREESPAPDGPAGTRLPSAGRRELRLLRTAAGHLDAGRPDEAVVYLQAILDAEADGFFEAEDGTGRLVSVRAEAAKRIDDLAGDARRAYELRYGNAAKGLLADALAERDDEKLAAVARRFPATDAGREAGYRLAAAALDRGEPLAAAARLERLRQSVAAGERPALLLRLAACYASLGDEERHEGVVAELVSLGGELRLGERTVAVTEETALRAALAGLRPTGSEASDWPVAGGNPGRTNHRTGAAGAAAGAAAGWDTSALPDPFSRPGATGSATEMRLRQWAAQTMLVELAAGRPAVSSPRPVATGGAVYFRTPGNVVAVDAASGEPRWRSLADPLCWDYLTGAVPASPEGEVAGRAFVGQRLWSDAAWGTLATDGRLVFAVEETGAATPLPPAPTPEMNQAAQALVLPLPFNRLAAYDAATGRRVWEAGGPPGEPSSLAGTFFLGPPVPAGGQWFALGEAAGVTRLVAIDPARPDGVLWTQPVAEHDSPIDRDPVRRTAGLSPCLAGGLLVCPVGPDLVVAVDPATRSLLWAFAPRSRPGERRPERLPAEQIPGRAAGPRPDAEATAPPDVVSAGRVLLIGSSADGLVALDPLDGSVLWDARRFALLWVFGAADEKAYLQSPTGVVAVRLSDGTPAWDTPAAIGRPSGRGVLLGDRLCVPLADATLAVLDAATGRTVATHPAPSGEPLGNLIVVGGSLVSQSSTRVVALPIPE